MSAPKGNGRDSEKRDKNEISFIQKVAKIMLETIRLLAFQFRR